MARRVDLAAPDEVEVRIPDPATDAKRVYSLLPRTRSQRHRIADANEALNAVEIPDDTDPTPEQEEALMRAVCDLISVMLSVPEDGPKAGDLLFDGWQTDKITDEQIMGLMEGLADAGSDPT